MAQPQSILTFDGKDDYVELPSASLPDGNEITISFWSKGGSSQPRSSTIFYAGTPSNLNARIVNIHLPWGNSHIYWDCGSVGNAYNRISQPAPTADIKGNWVHWAFTLNAISGKMTICRNGELWKEGGGHKRPIAPVGNVRIGCFNNSYYHHGSISDVRVWNRALEPAEIKATMATRLTGKEEGLVSYWPLDEVSGNKIIDQTGHGHDGTIHGATWETTTDLEFIPAPSPESLMTGDRNLSLLQFNGRNVFIDCGEPDLNNTSFTIEFWAKRDGKKAWNIAVQQGESGKDQSLHLGFRSTDVFTLAFHGDDLNTRKTYVDGEWHHWSCVYDRDRKRQEVFCDGKSVAARNCGLLKSNDVFYIGCGNGNRFFFDGAIAELRLWKTVRTVADIQKDMNIQLTGQEADLFAYWPLDDGKGTVARDATGNGHDGTIHNESWQNTEVPFQPRPVPEEKTQPTKPNSTLKFTNSKSPSDHVIVKPFANSPTHALTVEFWINVNKSGRNDGTPLGISTPNQFNEFIIYRCKGIAIYVHGAAQASSIAFEKGRWQHCAVTWESKTGQAHLYLDGESVFSTSLAKGAVLDPNGILVLGQEQDSYGGGFDKNQALQGQMAEVRVWNYVRPPEDIKAKMSQRCTGEEAGLVGYWPLDEGEGNVVHDKTGNGQDGELQGVTWNTPEGLDLKPIEPPKIPAKTPPSTSGFATISTPPSSNTIMNFPKLSPPVQRPHFIQPAACVDLENGSLNDLLHVRLDLLHAANYNDPAAYANRNFNQVMRSSAGQSASQGWGGFGRGMGG